MVAIQENRTMTCICEHVTAEVIQCPEHRRLYKGGIRLTSVSRIIGAIMPTDWSAIPADVLENARHRGEVVDSLFSAYVIGELDNIPAGTRTDAIALFTKLRTWFDRQNFSSVQSQIVLGCHDHGGVMDLRFDGMAVDLKATSKVEETAKLQMAAYADLDGHGVTGVPAAVLHVTERYAEPRLVPLTGQDYEDWRTMLAAWRMVKRRRPNAKEESE